EHGRPTTTATWRRSRLRQGFWSCIEAKPCSRLEGQERFTMMNMDTGLTVGRLAQVAGVKASTVRYYEELGLLPRPMRTVAGYRVFPHQAVRRLALVRAAQQFGFSLRDIASFFAVR